MASGVNCRQWFVCVQGWPLLDVKRYFRCEEKDQTVCGLVPV